MYINCKKQSKFPGEVIESQCIQLYCIRVDGTEYILNIGADKLWKLDPKFGKHPKTDHDIAYTLASWIVR